MLALRESQPQNYKKKEEEKEKNKPVLSQRRAGLIAGALGRYGSFACRSHGRALSLSGLRNPVSAQLAPRAYIAHYLSGGSTLSAVLCLAN